jgi:hypothetical protein
MPAKAGIAFVLLVTAAAAIAQPAAELTPFQRGKAAMDAHDPTSAIAHFEQVDTREGRAWLAVALMMEARSPSDQFVERAFDSAARARTDRPKRVRPRKDLAAALRPGEMVVTFLVGDTHAYAWAFDRETLIGYPLPPPAEIVTAVERVNGYIAKKDPAGVARVAEDLVPALLGPVIDRMAALSRVIFVMDGPLRRLPIGELPIADGASTLSQRMAVSTVEDDSLFDEIARTAPSLTKLGWPTGALAAIVAIGLLVVAVVALRRRSSVA